MSGQPPAASGVGDPMDAGGPLDIDTVSVPELDGAIIGAFDIADALSREHPGRVLSIVKTKLEEAAMWAARLNEDGSEATL